MTRRIPCLLGWAVGLAWLAAACTTPTSEPPAPTLAPTLAPPTLLAATATPAVPPTPTLAPEAEATAFAAAVVSAPATRVETAPAPDGVASAELWSADCATVGGFEHYGPVGYAEIRWLASPDSAPVLVARQILVCEGLGAGGLRVLQWSPDSLYLFFTDAAQGSPDGAGCPWFGRVLRWAVADGSTTTLGNGATSPDGRWVAGVTGPELTVWSWTSTDVKRAPVLEPGWPVSAIGWAPDGERVLFVQSESACGLGGSSVVGLYRVADGTVSELLRTQDPALLTFRFESVEDMTFYGASPDAHRYRLIGDQLLPAP